jgi:hypothetical protein
MRRIVAIMLPLALAACGGGATVPEGPETDRQACERQANNDPAVRAAVNRSIGGYRFVAEDQDQVVALKRRATIDCLKSRGVIQPGNVELPDPNAR